MLVVETLHCFCSVIEPLSAGIREGRCRWEAFASGGFLGVGEGGVEVVTREGEGVIWVEGKGEGSASAYAGVNVPFLHIFVPQTGDVQRIISSRLFTSSNLRIVFAQRQGAAALPPGIQFGSGATLS